MHRDDRKNRPAADVSRVVVNPRRRIRRASATQVRVVMRPGLGIAIGGAAIAAAIGGASVAFWQAGASTAELAGPSGGSLLGAADQVPAVPGLSPAWVLRTLPLLSQPAPDPASQPAPAVPVPAPAPAPVPAPAHAPGSVLAVLTSLPVHLTSPLPSLPIPLPLVGGSTSGSGAPHQHGAHHPHGQGGGAQS